MVEEDPKLTQPIRAKDLARRRAARLHRHMHWQQFRAVKP